MDNRERAMVEAAVECLSGMGRKLDDKCSTQDADYALAAAIRKADVEMVRESFSELHDDVVEKLRDLMADVLDSSDEGVFCLRECNKFAVEAVSNASAHFLSVVDEAKTKLPFDGESDEEGWRDIDNAQRLA